MAATLEAPRSVASVASPGDISLDTMLPDLLRAHPAVRTVFDRYGLRGCGGPHGPVESIGFFARTHGVDTTRILTEIDTAIRTAPIGAVPATSLKPALADVLYRRYFTAGIVAVLTAGATWGVWLLFKLAMAGRFTALPIQEINSHGHAQIYGWVGLFIMGFAYQAFPRIWHTDLAWPRLAVAALVSMLAGLVIRTVGMVLPGSAAVAPSLIGGSLEILSILIFVTQILATFFRSKAKYEPYVGFVVAALVFFVAQAFLDVWHTHRTLTAPYLGKLLWQIATWQAPLRDLQIHGLALLMILGVCLRMLPPLYGVPATSVRRASIALGLLVAAVIAEAVLFVGYRWTNNHMLAASLMLPWLVLTVGVAMVVLPWKLWRKFENADRSAKFIKAAYAWLAFSLVMLLLLPVWQAATKIPFSHAYYGAIRHAITVGFISLMIMGFAAKVVPTLNGLDVHKLSGLWGPFLLLNVGCFLRVTTQTLTDIDPFFYKVIGVSGCLEVTAIAWWGLGLVKIMRDGKRALALEAAAAENAEPECPSNAAPVVQLSIKGRKSAAMTVTPQTRVVEIYENHPQTQAIFDRYGFGLLRNPVMRKTVARNVTVAQATSMHSVPTAEFVAALNEVIAK